MATPHRATRRGGPGGPGGPGGAPQSVSRPQRREGIKPDRVRQLLFIAYLEAAPKGGVKTAEWETVSQHVFVPETRTRAVRASDRKRKTLPIENMKLPSVVLLVTVVVTLCAAKPAPQEPAPEMPVETVDAGDKMEAVSVASETEATTTTTSSSSSSSSTTTTTTTTAESVSTSTEAAVSTSTQAVVTTQSTQSATEAVAVTTLAQETAPNTTLEPVEVATEVAADTTQVPPVAETNELTNAAVLVTEAVASSVAPVEVNDATTTTTTTTVAPSSSAASVTSTELVTDSTTTTTTTTTTPAASTSTDASPAVTTTEADASDSSSDSTESAHNEASVSLISFFIVLLTDEPDGPAVLNRNWNRNTLSVSMSLTRSRHTSRSSSFVSVSSSSRIVHTSHGMQSVWNGQRVFLRWKNSRLIWPVPPLSLLRSCRLKLPTSRRSVSSSRGDVQHTYVKSMKSQSTSR
uniref:Uncharacterized protein n=1 Tax=Anopheles farauti TaxID=69004 RepID=A0A182QUE7_9DIPT